MTTLCLILGVTFPILPRIFTVSSRCFISSARFSVELMRLGRKTSLMSSIEEVMKLEGIVLIDMPGTLNAVNLDLLYKVADLAVVPISYDFDTIDATGLFIKVVRKMKDIKMIFLPNRINSTENRADEMKQREETVKILGRIGKVTPRIKQSVVIKRYSTVSPLDKYQKAAVEHAFDAIVEQIKL